MTTWTLRIPWSRCPWWARRIGQSVPTLFGVSVITWALVHLAPGDSAQIYARQFAESGRPTAEETDRARQLLALDGTLVQQYLHWLGRVLHGDFGRSFSTGRPIRTELLHRMPATIELAVTATLLTFVVGVALGSAAAATHRRSAEVALRGIAIAGGMAPAFLLGLLGIWLFAVRLDWLPSFGRSGLFSAGLVLPAAVLACVHIGATARLARSSTAEALVAEHVWAARARGLPERRVLRSHALRNALAPVVTQTATTLGGLFGGAVIVESVFAWPGMGKFTVDAVAAQDYPAIQAGVLATAVAYLVIGVLLDLLYRWLDPRIAIADDVVGFGR